MVVWRGEWCGMVKLEKHFGVHKAPVFDWWGAFVRPMVDQRHLSSTIGRVCLRLQANTLERNLIVAPAATVSPMIVRSEQYPAEASP